MCFMESMPESILFATRLTVADCIIDLRDYSLQYDTIPNDL